MSPIIPTIKSMTFNEADSAGLYSKGLILEHQGKTFNLNAGLRDTIHIFTESIFLYVLTINRPLGYIGLDAYYPSEEDPINTIFLHSDYQFTETLGSKWEQMSPRTMALRLTQYLM